MIYIVLYIVSLYIYIYIYIYTRIDSTLPFVTVGTPPSVLFAIAEAVPPVIDAGQADGLSPASSSPSAAQL